MVNQKNMRTRFQDSELRKLFHEKNNDRRGNKTLKKNWKNLVRWLRLAKFFDMKFDYLQFNFLST